MGGIYYFKSYKKFKNILLFIDYIKFDLIFLFAIFFVFNFFLIEFDFYIIFSSRSFLLLFIFLSIIFFIENFLSIKLISIHFDSRTFFLLDWIFLRANWWSFVSDLLMNDKIQIKRETYVVISKVAWKIYFGPSTFPFYFLIDTLSIL